MNENTLTADWPTQEQTPAPESYHIEATKSLVERTLRTLKHDDLFGVFDKQGNCQGGADGPDGIFYKDTRFLSGLGMRVGGMEPLQLSSVVLDDNGAMIVDLANADLHDPDGRVWLQRDSLYVGRLKFLCGTTCYERIRVRRFGPCGRVIPLEISFDADFADLFEVRGERRAKRGTRKVAKVDDCTVRFSYVGLDDVQRLTTLHFDPAPSQLDEHQARWDLDVDASERINLVMKIDCKIADEAAEPPHILSAFRTMRRTRKRRNREQAWVDSSNELFNTVVDRAVSDIDMLLTDTDYGLYPYAGVPWYSTIFGRDGIITAIELLWAAPDIAKGVLNALATTQATEVDEAADAQPGKILHEMRGGEMARLGEVPFRRYYGSVDATPLFVMLAGLYLKRSGDLDTIRAIWPNIRAALAWIDGSGDPDGDGFVEYARMTDTRSRQPGLEGQLRFDLPRRRQQRRRADRAVRGAGLCLRRQARRGRDCARAWRGRDGAAAAGRSRGDAAAASRSISGSKILGCYALALDGQKQPCRVLSSNAGHALFAGIASPERAARLARLLTEKRFFSGWGIRTIAQGEARYNPMSYHNGSVWPHDNALIAMGLARYGHKAEVLKIFQGLIEAAFTDEFRRLPELFCGFSRRKGRGPTSYPVACSPQAWAAAAPFALIAAATGLELAYGEDEVRLANPTLPRLYRRSVLARCVGCGIAPGYALVAQRRRCDDGRHPAQWQSGAGDRQII